MNFGLVLADWAFFSQTFNFFKSKLRAGQNVYEIAHRRTYLQWLTSTKTLIPRVGFRTAHMFLSMHFTRLIKIVENFWNERSLNNYDRLEIDLEFRTWARNVKFKLGFLIISKDQLKKHWLYLDFVLKTQLLPNPDSFLKNVWTES